MKQKILLQEKEKLEIIKNILKTIKDHNNSITRKAVFNVIKIDRILFDRIFKELFDKEFVRHAGKGKSNKFSLTDRGFGYLSRYASMVKFIEDFRL
jgi:predicted transcriptional regulator